MDLNEIGRIVSSKVKELSQNTVSEVQKMNEIRQVKSKISDQRKTIDDLYGQIGRCDQECERKSDHQPVSERHVYARQLFDKSDR